MKYDHPEVIEPALDVIKSVDPEIYSAMMRSRWHVHVVTRIEQDDLTLDLPGEYKEMDDIQDTPGVEAMTSLVLPGKPTDVLFPFMKEHEAHFGAPFSHALAVNLVHEFVHHHGLDEVPAYQSSAEFAAKLGDSALRESSEAGMFYAELSSLFGQ